MLCSLLTVVFYAASSLGDKFISEKLDCNAREFSFLVSAATALFLALMLPFLDWSFAFSWRALVILLLLIAFKIGEFYTSAYLLKTVSAYELKAWLSINVILSFLVDLGRGKETFFRKKGLLLGALTRLPNAAGLWTEAIAAQQNLLLYSLVQPMQLLILFATALIRREKLGKAKLIGSILSLVAVTVMTVLIYINRGTI